MIYVESVPTLRIALTADHYMGDQEKGIRIQARLTNGDVVDVYTSAFEFFPCEIGDSVADLKRRGLRIIPVSRPGLWVLDL